MNLFQVIIIGFVEGITEFLPISSTAHMSITKTLLGIPDINFTVPFEISLQFGAILSVLVYFYSDFLNIDTIKKLIITTIPTAIIGFVFKDYLTDWINNLHIISYSLIIGGIAILISEHFYKYNNLIITNKKSFMLGLFQGIAVLPGVSRSGAMLVLGKALGISKEELFKYTFLAAVPIMGLATAYSILRHYSEIANSLNYTDVIIGSLVSFITALFVIKSLMFLIRKIDFKFFGIYRIIVGVIILFVL